MKGDGQIIDMLCISELAIRDWMNMDLSCRR